MSLPWLWPSPPSHRKPGARRSAVQSQVSVKRRRRLTRTSVSGGNAPQSRLTSEMSKVKSSVFPGKALAEPSHTLLTSRLERSPGVWPYAG